MKNAVCRPMVLGSMLLLVCAVSGWAVDAPADAAKTYAAKCVSCHGKDGKGNPAMAKVFKVEPAALDVVKKGTLEKTDAYLGKVIKDGLNKMPAYKDKLSDADISGVVAYVRGLANTPEPVK